MQRYTEVVTKAGDRVIDTVGKAQNAAVSAVSTVSKTIGDYLPELPQLPLVSSLPTPKEIVSTTFGLWEHALKTQKQYALGIAKAIEPVTGKVIQNGTTRKATKASA